MKKMIAGLLLLMLVLLVGLSMARAQTDSTGIGGLPGPEMGNIFSVGLWLLSTVGIPFIVDKLAPVTWSGAQKTALVISLALASALLDLASQGKLHFDNWPNLVTTLLTLLGSIQVYYQLVAKTIGLEGPKTKILDQARMQMAQQVDALSHERASEVIDTSKSPSIELKAVVK